MTRTTRTLDELATDIPPERDLWPGIAARLETAAPAPKRSRPRWMVVLPGAALAAVVLLAAGLVWLQVTARTGGEDYSQDLAALPPDARAGVEAGLAEVRATQARIEAALERGDADPQLQEWLINSRQEEARIVRAVFDAGTTTRVL